jgi:phosphoglycolate phosphatase
MCTPPSLRTDRIRGIVFDLDGTLVDSYAAITESLNAVRSAFSLPPLDSDLIRRRVGRGLESLISELVGDRSVDEGVRIFEAHYERVYRALTVALPGVDETLAELHRRGFRMSVASNKPAGVGRPILEALDLLRYLDGVQGPDLAGRTKPDPAMLRACLDLMGLDRHQTLYVGDMVLDVSSAGRAGLAVVLVPGGSSGSEELSATGERVLGQFSDLTRILGNPGPAA